MAADVELNVTKILRGPGETMGDHFTVPGSFADIGNGSNTKEFPAVVLHHIKVQDDLLDQQGESGRIRKNILVLV